jgi:enediyne polyketide synthase
MVAADWLRSRRCDVVRAGGVDADLSAESYVGFCRTDALSRAGSAPFSRAADGFVMGEGAAVFALKRLRDAERDGDPIRAVLYGVGQASDGRGRGITAPRAEGQQLAIRRAWDEAGIGAASIGVIEAHGTGTALGDATEVDVLSRALAGAPGPVWLGSVKSGIGHLKGAAGAAGLLKVVLSLETGIVPPTLRAGPFADGLLREGPLALPRSPVHLHRRVGVVSAFGFGGTDFHGVVAAPERRTAAAEALRATAEPLVLGPEIARWPADGYAPLLLAYGGDDDAELLAAVRADRALPVERAAASRVRLVALAEPGRREETVEAAARWLSSRAAGDRHRGRTLFHGEGRPADLLWAFPGQGSQRAGALDAVARLPAGARALASIEVHLRVALGSTAPLREWEARAAEGDGDPLAVHVLLFAAGVAWAEALSAAGLPCHGAVGHSIGGFAAAVAAGALSPSDAASAVVARGTALAACPPGAMLAVRASEREAAEIATEHGLWVAAINTPGDCVLAGDAERVEAAARALGVARARRVPVSRAYHTPLVAPAVDAVRAALAPCTVHRPRLPLWSAAAGSVVDGVAEDLAAAIVDPVRFDRVVAAQRATVLVELGPGRTLGRFAAAGGMPAVPMDPHDGSAPAVAAAMLAAAGHTGLARAMPATWIDHPLPAPVRAAGSRAPSRRATPAAVAAVIPPASDDEVRTAVRAAICEVTGYPPEVVDDGAELEGDLGVDSIRKMEILGLLEKRFGFTTAESDYAMLARADLGELVAHVRARLASGEREAPVAVSPVSIGARIFVEQRVTTRSEERADVVVPPGADPARIVRRMAELARTKAPGPLSVRATADAAGEAAVAFLRSVQRERGLPLRVTGLEHRPLLASLRPGRPLPPRPVVVATGSPSGILGPCLLGLADLDPSIVVLSRSISDRDVEPLRAAGLRIASIACDVTDRAALGAAIAATLAEHDRIDVVLHAAGVLRDGLAESLSHEDIDAVWRPKWDGAQHLIEATRTLELFAFVTFSSIVARLGNAGQAAYAAANAAMTTLVHPSARTVHVAWTAWSTVGMAAAPVLQQAFASRGVVPLAPELGRAALRTVLDADLTGTVWVTAQDPPGAIEPDWPLGAPSAWSDSETRFPIPLDPQSGMLMDHRVAGRPLVPAAVWIVAILAAARARAGAGGSWSIDAFDIQAPTFVDRVRHDVEAVLANDGPSRWAASIRAGGTVVATASIARCSAPHRAVPPIPLVDAEPGAALYRPDLLFHGPTWHVLERMRTDGNGHAQADLRDGPIGRVTGALDGAHQLLAAWSGRSAGWMGLPVGATRWVVGPDSAGPLRLETRAEADGTEMRADVRAVDASGRVVLRGTGVRLRAAAGVDAK